MYFNTYPVTANMGLREAINAILSHVAYNGRQFGYLPSAVHEANYAGLADDYAQILNTSGDSPALAPRVTDSALLADLVDVLIGLCNDYPVYDDERVAEIEEARLFEMLNEVHKEGEPKPELIGRALFEIGTYIEQSEYGANVSESDYENAVAYAREHFGVSLPEPKPVEPRTAGISVGDTIKTWQGEGVVTRVGTIAGFYMLDGREARWDAESVLSVRKP